MITDILEQRWSRGHKLEAKDTKKSEAKDSPFDDRPSRGQGQEYSRPRPRTKDTGASVLQKNGLQKFFSGNLQSFNNSKNNAVLEPKTGYFSRTWDFEAKVKDIKMCLWGRPRGQGRPRGLHLFIRVGEKKAKYLKDNEQSKIVSYKSQT